MRGKWAVMYMCVKGTEPASFYGWILQLFRECGIFVFHFICFPSNYIPPTCNVLYIDKTKSQNTMMKCANYLFSIFMGIHMFIVSSRVLWVYEQHGGYRIRSRNCLPIGRNWVHSRVFGGFVLIFILVFCIVLCFVVLFVFVLCLVCPKMPVPLSILDFSFSFFIAITVE